MTTSSSPMTGNGVAIASYMLEESLAGYYIDEQDGPRPGRLRPDDVVFRADQLLGGGAEALGLDLSRGLTLEQFSALCAGSHPVTGERVVAPGYAKVYELDADGQEVRDLAGHRVQAKDPETGQPLTTAVHKAGVDVYLAAPKSVSIAAAVAARVNPEMYRAVIGAQDSAVRETMAWVEATALLGRRPVQTPTEAGARLVTKGPRKGEQCRTQGSRSDRVAVSLIIATSLQHTARPTEATMERGAPPDMHLHNHNFIVSVAVDPETGKTVSVDDYGLKSTAVERDARYLGSLARHLELAGIEITYGSFEDSKGGRVPWVVTGITPEAINHYSSNRNRAFDLAKDYEDETGKAATAKVLKDRMKGTRRSKDPLAKAMDTRPVHQLWHDDAQRSGITLATPDLVQRLAEGGRAVTVAPEADRKAVLWDRLYSAKGLTSRDAAFDSATVTDALARSAEGLSFSPDELDSLELEVFDQLVVVRTATDPRHVLYTTTPNLVDEGFIAATLATKAAATYDHPTPAAVERAIADLEVALDAEQRVVVEQASAGTGAVFIEGYAGAGKTTAMKAVVAAHRAEGTVDQVIVISTAARTALDSGHKLGADFAGPVEALALAVEKGRVRLTSRSLVIFDESAMCDTGRQVNFLNTIGPARVIYVGDPEQSQPVGRAGWYGDATDVHDTALLTAVHRHADRRDVTDFGQLRDGHADEVVTSLAARGRFHVASDQQESLTQVMEDYAWHRSHGRSADDVRLILDSSNQTVDLANRQVQRYRLQAGEIKERGFEVEAKSDGRHWTLRAGDPVLFLTAYGKGQSRIANGTTATLTSVDDRTGRAVLSLAGGRRATVKLEHSAETQPVGLAYAVHTQKYQGGEIPIALYMPGPLGTTDKFSAYSSLTRCTQEAHVYANREIHGDEPEDALAQAMAKAERPRSAHSFLAEIDDDTDRVQAADLLDTSRPESSEPVTLEHAATAARPSVTRPSASDRMWADVQMDRLARVVGTEAAERVQASEAYPTLVGRLDDLDRSGANANAMLRTVAHQRSLDGAQDPAAVLVARLDRTDRIERDAAPEASLVPPAEWVPPAEQVRIVRPREARSADLPSAPSERRRGFDRDSAIDQALGDDAGRVRAAPAYSSLRGRLDDLDRSGADASAMLATVAHQRSLDGAQDPAAVLVARLERTERIEQGGRSGPASEQREAERRAMDQAIAASWVRNQRSRDDERSLGLER